MVIENKAVVAGSEALEQVRRYMASARETLARGSEKVFGLLLADGSTVELGDLLAADVEPDAGYVSLAALGYRRHLRDAAVVVRDVEDDPLRLLTTITEPLHAVGGRGLSAKDQAAHRSPGPWVVGGQEFARRADANRALARQLGRYDRATWESAQRDHGLRAMEIIDSMLLVERNVRASVGCSFTEGGTRLSACGLIDGYSVVIRRRPHPGAVTPPPGSPPAQHRSRWRTAPAPDPSGSRR